MTKHIIDTRQFKERALMHNLLEEVEGMRTSMEKGLSMPQHSGKIVASLFYEPSTRTKLSFDSAAKRLGAQVIGTENAAEFSSAVKGETLEHSIQATQSFYDAIVLRHPENGSALRAAKVSKKPVINAGDGNNQHPTQALLDLYTIDRELGRIDDLDVAFVGDLRNARTVRSLAYLLANMKYNRLHFISPPQLGIGQDILRYLDSKDVEHEESDDMNCLKEADILYVTRLQRERFQDRAEYKRMKESCQKFAIDRQKADMMKKGIIMHPLPINTAEGMPEILPDVDNHPRARYFEQSNNGLYVRMALLNILFRGEESHTYRMIEDVDDI